MQRFFFFILINIGVVACSPGRRIGKAQQALLKDTALVGAHVGISLYDPASGHYLYNYQGDHYFVPASNTKLFTCYAAMKYLGDSLVGLRYYESPDTIYILPTGDPTLREGDYSKAPVDNFFRLNEKPIAITDVFWKAKKYGKGWAWDDYMEDYMPERSPMPIYGNTARVEFRRWDNEKEMKEHPEVLKDTNDYIPMYGLQSNPSLGRGVKYFQDSSVQEVVINKMMESDSFTVRFPYQPTFWMRRIPFVTNGLATTLKVVGKNNWRISNFTKSVLSHPFKILYSQPTDSLLKPMMHRSDNFFAEQSLLMVSNEKLGYMNDEAIIDTLLKNDLKDLPQKPVWVDGSGLSRYNQFTPQDIVTVLLKIKNEFGLERIRTILPKGNTGTLTNYYEKLGSAIFAKTGSLSGQVALSGYLTCKSGKLLLFSILVNNHNSSGRAVRRAVEKFVMQVWGKN